MHLPEIDLGDSTAAHVLCSDMHLTTYVFMHSRKVELMKQTANMQAQCTCNQRIQ